MFNLTKISSFGIKSITKINCQTINKTIVRNRRQTISRRPVKILTDSGEDFYKQNAYQKSVTSADYEIKPNQLKGKQRKDYNKYYDDGYDEEFMDFTSSDVPQDNQRQPKNSSQSKANPKTNSDIKEKQFKSRTKGSNDVKNSSEKVLKPKISGIPVYERVTDKSSEFANIMSALKQRKRREKDNLMLLEGKRLICDAIDANIRLKTIYFTREDNLIGIQQLDQLVSTGVQLKKVLYRDMQLFSELITSPGVVAISERPNRKSLDTIAKRNSDQILPLILIGDNIRDPGNLGTLVRCAAAVGAQQLVLLKGCADVWESKVLRSGAGSHFRIPIHADIEWPVVFNYMPIDKPFDLFIADSNNNFNNRSQEPANSSSDIPSHTITTITREIDYLTEQTYMRDESYADTNPELKKYRNMRFSSSTYTDTKFYTSGIERPIVLVIGGETHGLSDQSYKLAYDFIGRKIRIPLALGVDSLNSAIAAAVIMYEMKRQFDFQNNTLFETLEKTNV